MHHLPPTAASIFRGLLFWVPLHNPTASLFDGRPTLDGQHASGFLQRVHNTCVRLGHCAIRVNAIFHEVVECI